MNMGQRAGSPAEAPVLPGLSDVCGLPSGGCRGAGPRTIFTSFWPSRHDAGPITAGVHTQGGHRVNTKAFATRQCRRDTCEVPCSIPTTVQKVRNTRRKADTVHVCIAIANILRQLYRLHPATQSQKLANANKQCHKSK